VVRQWQEWNLTRGAAPENNLDHEIIVLCESEKNNVEHERQEKDLERAKRRDQGEL
jgi:hypothetical protein